MSAFWIQRFAESGKEIDRIFVDRIVDGVMWAGAVDVGEVERGEWGTVFMVYEDATPLAQIAWNGHGASGLVEVSDGSVQLISPDELASRDFRVLLMHCMAIASGLAMYALMLRWIQQGGYTRIG